MATYEELAHAFDYPEDPRLQEIYVQTFDCNADCSLEIGWHLFGENYARGEFLVNLRREMRRLGVAETTELPDHLTHVLRVLGRLDEPEAARLAGEFILPALDKILAKLEGKGNPYEAPLRAVKDSLARYEAFRAPAPPELFPIFQEEML